MFELKLYSSELLLVNALSIRWLFFILIYGFNVLKQYKHTVFDFQSIHVSICEVSHNLEIW